MKAAFFLIVTTTVLLILGGVKYENVVTAGYTQTDKGAKRSTPGAVQDYEQDSTRQLVALVKDAAEMIRNMGEAAFEDFQRPDSYWRQGARYVFVLDPEGNVLVHADPELKTGNQFDQKDAQGKPVVRGLIEAATRRPEKPEGWYHYQWTLPGEQVPRWKSSYVRLVKAPSGKTYIVGSGMYNDYMERAFVVDMVKRAVGEIEKYGREAFPLLRDPSGPFMAKDAYVIVVDPKGMELVNPAFKGYEGKNVLNLKDTFGKFLIKDMLEVVKNDSSGWVDYMWPRPGEKVSKKKSTYVSKAKLGDSWVLVGAGVYLPDTTAVK